MAAYVTAQLKFDDAVSGMNIRIGMEMAITHSTVFSIATSIYAFWELKISAIVLTVHRLVRWIANPIRAASDNEIV